MGNETVRTIHNEIIPLNTALKWFDVSPIIKRFGDWAVTTYGVECLMSYYPIEAGRLNTESWVAHLLNTPRVRQPYLFEACLNYAKLYFIQRTCRRVVPAGLRQFIFKRDGHRCVICGSTQGLTLDHVIPVSKGGRTSKENLKTLCKSCNSKKNTQGQEFYKNSFNCRPTRKKQNSPIIGKNPLSALSIAESNKYDMPTINDNLQIQNGGTN